MVSSFAVNMGVSEFPNTTKQASSIQLQRAAPQTPKNALSIKKWKRYNVKRKRLGQLVRQKDKRTQSRFDSSENFFTVFMIHLLDCRTSA